MKETLESQAISLVQRLCDIHTNMCTHDGYHASMKPLDPNAIFHIAKRFVAFRRELYKRYILEKGEDEAKKLCQVHIGYHHTRESQLDGILKFGYGYTYMA